MSNLSNRLFNQSAVNKQQNLCLARSFRGQYLIANVFLIVDLMDIYKTYNILFFGLSLHYKKREI